jgi:hypothetical protein
MDFSSKETSVTCYIQMTALTSVHFLIFYKLGYFLYQFLYASSTPQNVAVPNARFYYVDSGVSRDLSFDFYRTVGCWDTERMAGVYSSGSFSSLSTVDTNISYTSIHGFFQGVRQSLYAVSQAINNDDF